MASPRPEITPAAIEELESAAKWYRDHSVAAEEEFLDAFQSAYRLLAEYPNSGRQYLYGTRSLLLPKFRYIIVYLIRDEAPVVIASPTPPAAPDTGATAFRSGKQSARRLLAGAIGLGR